MGTLVQRDYSRVPQLLGKLHLTLERSALNMSGSKSSRLSGMSSIGTKAFDWNNGGRTRASAKEIMAHAASAQLAL